jgi:hypothetical protein
MRSDICGDELIGSTMPSYHRAARSCSTVAEVIMDFNELEEDSVSWRAGCDLARGHASLGCLGTCPGDWLASPIT